MAKKKYDAMSVDELDAELIRRVNEKDEYLAGFKAEHAEVQAAHERAVARELEERADAQTVSPEGIESEEATSG